MEDRERMIEMLLTVYNFPLKQFLALVTLFDILRLCRIEATRDATSRSGIKVTANIKS